MKVLVTGGAGYVGAVVCRLLLSAGCKVRVLDNLSRGDEGLRDLSGADGFEFQQGDVRHEHDVVKALVDREAVVHLAAIVGCPACEREPEAARGINLEGTYKLIAAARSTRLSRFVFASTCSNYATADRDDRWVDESSPVKAVSVYTETKIAAEREVMAWGAAADSVATVLRLSTVYGVSPRMRLDLTVNEFTSALVLGRKLEVFHADAWRSYCHVADVGRAILKVLRAPAERVANRLFNVGDTGENYTKRMLIDAIRLQIGSGTVDYRGRSADTRDYRVKSDRIADELGFKISKTVADGIREVAALAANN